MTKPKNNKCNKYYINLSEDDRPNTRNRDVKYRLFCNKCRKPGFSSKPIIRICDTCQGVPK